MLTIQYHSDNTTTRIYTPSREIMRIVNSSGTFDYRYVYMGDKLVARVNPDGSKYFYHSDMLGSTSLITDELGTEVETTQYSSFGSIESGGDTDRKGYTGHEHDDTGLTYMKARYYDSEKGQFISPDTVIQNTYDPRDLNHYSYVRNSPYKYTDPTGHVVCGGFCVGLLFIGIAMVTSLPGIINMQQEEAEQGYISPSTALYFYVGTGMMVVGGLALIPQGVSAIATSGLLIKDSHDLHVSAERRNYFAATSGHVQSNTNLPSSHTSAILESMGNTAISGADVTWYYNAAKNTYISWTGEGRPSNPDYNPISDQQGSQNQDSSGGGSGGSDGDSESDSGGWTPCPPSGCGGS